MAKSVVVELVTRDGKLVALFGGILLVRFSTVLIGCRTTAD